MKVKTAAPSSARRSGEDLDRRYGKIGISAVAAALRYQSVTKNNGNAPATAREDHRRSEMAAA